MKPKAFNFYLDYDANLADLTNEEVGELVRSLLYYANTGEVPEMTKIVKVAFTPMRKRIDEEFNNYELKCKTNAENVKKRWEKERGKDDTNVYERIPTDTKRYENIRIVQKEEEKEEEKEKEVIRRENVREKKTSFSKPSLKDVTRYCAEKGYIINVDHFYNYYESNGWMVGRNKMKDWRAAVRSWAARERKDPKKQSAIDMFSEYIN